MLKAMWYTNTFALTNVHAQTWWCISTYSNWVTIGSGIGVSPLLRSHLHGHIRCIKYHLFTFYDHFCSESRISYVSSSIVPDQHTTIKAQKVLAEDIGHLLCIDFSFVPLNHGLHYIRQSHKTVISSFEIHLWPFRKIIWGVCCP